MYKRNALNIHLIFEWLNQSLYYNAGDNEGEDE
jgi:hypothetical protein